MGAINRDSLPRDRPRPRDHRQWLLEELRKGSCIKCYFFLLYLKLSFTYRHRVILKSWATSHEFYTADESLVTLTRGDKIQQNIRHCLVIFFFIFYYIFTSFCRKYKDANLKKPTHYYTGNKWTDCVHFRFKSHKKVVLRWQFRGIMVLLQVIQSLKCDHTLNTEK